MWLALTLLVLLGLTSPRSTPCLCAGRTGSVWLSTSQAWTFERLALQRLVAHLGHAASSCSRPKGQRGHGVLTLGSRRQREFFAAPRVSVCHGVRSSLDTGALLKKWRRYGRARAMLRMIAVLCACRQACRQHVQPALRVLREIQVRMVECSMHGTLSNTWDRSSWVRMLKGTVSCKDATGILKVAAH